MIYFYSHDISGGNRTGITKVGLQTLKVLNSSLKEFTVVTSASRNQLRNRLGIVDVNFSVKRSRLRTEYIKNKVRRELARIVNTFRLDIRSLKFDKNDLLLLNHIEFDNQFLEFCTNCRAIKIAWIHGTPEAYLAEKRTSILISRIIEVYNQMDVIVHLNSNSVDGWAKLGLKVKHVILSNTIEEKDLSIPLDKEIDVLIVGTLTKRKGYNKLINLVKNNSVPFNISIIGKDPKTEYSKNLLDEISDQSNLNYLGSVSNALSYIRAAKVVWCMSEGEGQSLALLESLFAGKPIISTQFPGIEDIVDHGANGYIIEAHNELEFISKTVSILSNNLTQFSERSYEIYSANFSNQVYYKKLNEIIIDGVTNNC